MAEDEGDLFTFENLGGGQEVGRSCHVLQFKGKCVMVGNPECIYLRAQLTWICSLMQEFIQPFRASEGFLTTTRLTWQQSTFC